eukprot:CAMPEP_0185264438 /NCGR_PEP_ID=MMETSP1359-20130426/22927_1 /TAXON_ID=552665 /ORGANISM="Bigelowiella longifila, Strain CCMP242" /LENGTH=43 /DNA_ID= /DNA_START= /DNA_END= /DNA_ORIENTATION=
MKDGESVAEGDEEDEGNEEDVEDATAPLEAASCKNLFFSAVML